MPAKKEEFEPRRAPKGAVVSFSSADGSTRDIEADEDGVIYPQSAEEVATLDALDLPVARKVIEESKADEKPKE